MEPLWLQVETIDRERYCHHYRTDQSARDLVRTTVQNLTQCHTGKVFRKFDRKGPSGVETLTPSGSAV